MLLMILGGVSGYLQRTRPKLQTSTPIISAYEHGDKSPCLQGIFLTKKNARKSKSLFLFPNSKITIKGNCL
jgi:hypothetical protein